MENDREITLKELFDEVDLLLKKLEQPDTSLEDGFAAYQKGRELLRLCEEKIDRIEKKVLMLDDEGQYHELP